MCFTSTSHCWSIHIKKSSDLYLSIKKIQLWNMFLGLRLVIRVFSKIFLVLYCSEIQNKDNIQTY